MTDLIIDPDLESLIETGFEHLVTAGNLLNLGSMKEAMEHIEKEVKIYEVLRKSNNKEYKRDVNLLNTFYECLMDVYLAKINVTGGKIKC